MDRWYDPNWKWLESTKKLQRDAYGFDADALDTAGQAESVKENVLPLMVEALELLNEVSWKYWAHDEPFVNRREVLREAVDIGHFLGNILVAIEVTDEEWAAAYQAKQQVNRQRQLDGYTVRNKEKETE